MADLTDGKSYFVRDEDTSEKINEAFLQALTYQPAVTASTGLYVKVIFAFSIPRSNEIDQINFLLVSQLYDQIVMADEPRHVEGQFEVDLSVGSNLRLIVFGLGKKSSIGSMKLTGPDGQSADRVEYDGSAAFVKIDLAKVTFLYFRCVDFFFMRVKQVLCCRQASGRSPSSWSNHRNLRCK